MAPDVIFAASVLAATAVLRSLFGAVFPLFTPYMYRNLGIHWASSVPAFLALACLPFPFLFYKFGMRIRMSCKFAAEAAEVLTRMRTRQDVPEDVDADFEEAEERGRAFNADKDAKDLERGHVPGGGLLDSDSSDETVVSLPVPPKVHDKEAV